VSEALENARSRKESRSFCSIPSVSTSLHLVTPAEQGSIIQLAFSAIVYLEVTANLKSLGVRN
jgi:hypothetical protein